MQCNLKLILSRCYVLFEALLLFAAQYDNADGHSITYVLLAHIASFFTAIEYTDDVANKCSHTHHPLGVK